MIEPRTEYELQRIADNLESVVSALIRINDTIDNVRFQMVKDAEARKEQNRTANEIARRGL